MGNQEVIGRSHYEVFPEISERWKEFHRRGLAGETMKESNDPFPRADGTTDWVRWEIRPWHETENQIGGIILFSEVITTQVEAREALKESEIYNRMLFEQSAIGLALISFDGRLVDINTTFATTIGRTVDEAKTLTYWDITPEKYQNQEQHQLDLLAKTGRYGPYEKEYIHKDGYLVPVRLQGLIIERHNEKFIWSSVEDISEQKKAELELSRLFESEKTALTEVNKSKEQLSQILERISDGFGSLDRNWNYTFINEKLAQNVGRKRKDLLGHNIWKVFPEAIGTPVHKAYLHAMEEQVVTDLEHFYPHFGKWFQHRFYPSPDGLSVFSKDITESKMAEEKIRENSSLIRIAAEKAKLGGWNVDLKENRSYWSDEVAAIHEMPPGYAPLVEDGINFYAPEWHERIIKVFTDCAEKGVPYDEEMEIITSTGKRVWVRTIGEAVRAENGKIVKVQGAFQDISERKKAEAKSREKDLQFRKLSANVPDLIFQFTRKTDGTYCVPVASEGIINIFGCSPEDVVDDFTPIGTVIYPDDAERVIADIEHSARHLTHFTCEFRVQIPGRPVQWILSRSTPEKLPDGSITWYGFNADITEQKNAELALRESEERFSTVFDKSAFVGALSSLTDGVLIAVNKAFMSVFGFEREEALGKTTLTLGINPDAEGRARVLEELKKNGSVRNLELRMHTKSGEEKFFAVNIDVIEIGGQQYLLNTMQDITERKNAELDLMRMASLLKNSQEIAHLGSFEYVVADQTTIWSEEEYRLYGLDPNGPSPEYNEMLEKCIHPDDAKMLHDTFISAMQSQVVYELEHRIVRPDGSLRWVYDKAYPYFDEHGNLLRYVGATLDTTDRKRLQEELEKLNTELEKKVEQRTAQLEAANKELETFTYSVSHDLKAPLRGIDGYSKLLSDLYAIDLNDEAKHFISTIRKSTQLMSQLIDDLLQYSRLERSQLRSEPVLIKPFVDAILRINEDEIISHLFSVTIDIPETAIIADSNGIQMALRNLIENAIKFTKTVPEPTIEIKQEESESSWIISVKDNGMGFDMKYSQRIFEIFQRLHRVEDYPGTGIGLAMVGKAMQRMNGRAWAESISGQGATFYLEIPKPIE